MVIAQNRRVAAALALALLLHAMLLLRISADSGYDQSGSAGLAAGAGDAAQTMIDVWLQPPPAVITAVAGTAPAPLPVAEQAPVAVARATQSAGGGGRGGYLAQVRARIEQQRRTLEVAVRGSAQVGFTVMTDGSVAALQLERSAGHAELDAEALQLVQRAVPLPLPPRQQPLRLSVPVLFE